MLTIWTVLRSPAARWLGLACAVAVLVGWAYLAADSRGYARCEGEHELADMHAAEEAHQLYLAEVARGEAISEELAITQRRLNETKTEYLAYANSIGGHCPDSLRVFMSYPAPGGQPSEPASPSADPAATVDASVIAGNIAENRWRFEVNYATCAALIQWHAGQEKDLKK
jgi:hypothetical protein